MMTWDELSEHVRERWKVAIDSKDRLGLLWSIGEPPAVEEQRETVELIHGAGVPYVQITADVAPEERLSSVDAARHRSTVAVGELALDRSIYVLRAVLPLDVLSIQVLDQSLELVAHEAARIRHGVD